MEFFEAVKSRHSVRKFQDKAIEQPKIDKMLEAMNLAPSAGDLQAYDVVLIKDSGRKMEIAQAALGQDFIAEAPVVLVFFANPKKSGIKYGSRGEQLYCIQDATIAAAYLQLAATSLGLATAWVGAFDEEEIKAIVNAPKYFIPIAIIPVGYGAEEPDITPRRKISEIVREEGF